MKNSLSLILTAALLYSCSKDSVDTPVIPTDPVVKNTTPVGVDSIAGVNWADARDNFVDGWVIPSGLEAGDEYATVFAKSEGILTGFQNHIKGLNTIRLPINPPSVNDIWWSRYKGAIDKAISKKIRVVLCCWESASAKNGVIDNSADFWQMWTKVVQDYGNNPYVYFEVINEPYGYSLQTLSDVYAEFLQRFPTLSRKRIILSGTGYSEDVTGIGADSRFSECLLALHNYAFWTNRTLTEWESDWRRRMGSYAKRTIVSEFGVAMSTGKDYIGGTQSDNEIAYMIASSNVFRNDKVASIYWPGLRDGDSYSLFSREGTGTSITLKIINQSGISRLRYGWGIE